VQPTHPGPDESRVPRRPGAAPHRATVAAYVVIGVPVVAVIVLHLAGAVGPGAH
jgi:hypothetical protein